MSDLLLMAWASAQTAIEWVGACPDVAGVSQEKKIKVFFQSVVGLAPRTIVESTPSVVTTNTTNSRELGILTLVNMKTRELV